MATGRVYRVFEFDGPLPDDASARARSAASVVRQRGGNVVNTSAQNTGGGQATLSGKRLETFTVTLVFAPGPIPDKAWRACRTQVEKQFEKMLRKPTLTKAYSEVRE